MDDIQDLDWYKSYNACQTLVGKKVKVDDKFKGIISGVFGGPLEIFLMIDIGAEILYIDIRNSLRVDIQE